ncbi:TonB-dependent receptor [Xanthobacter autotrophicus]|uniref:TonB-dependent receptor family protein n=1 Tax=Xanthobacter TaxID=279 RepID=UPI0024AC45B6|nr:TonB-dependent receptor [Xanthobacter autotrophicus]MDI4662815.1 TonB-dependent receptor [Xanthobacter autotrophicus]
MSPHLPCAPLAAHGARTRAATLLLLASVALPIGASQSTALAQEATALPDVQVDGDDSTTSLTVATEAQARAAIERTPGGAEVVPDTAWRDGRALTIKDMLDFVPGVFAQTKWGEDTRLSIRGSGVSRNFHLRGIQLFQDGIIPLNSADGGGDFQEIDPTAFRYVEVFKGANGYQFGANALGGAINFVTPTGRDSKGFEARIDAGSFDFYRFQASAGGAMGTADGFITASALTSGGYRQHSAGDSVRASGNFGWRPSETFETRFFFNANDIEQQIPGAVSKTAALTDPQAANPTNVKLDYQRNIQSARLANKSAWVVSDTTRLEFGGFVSDKSLDHPIFQVLDNQYVDYGGFARLVDERQVAGFANRLTAGITTAIGNIDAKRYVNQYGNPGALTFAASEDATTTTVYAEDNFYLTRSFALVGAFQYLTATRERTGIYNAATGEQDYTLFLPKGGVVWDVGPGAQVFGNISNSGEVPTFSELTNFASPILSNLKAQTATTYEIGSRGRSEDFTWDVSLYRSNVMNELQCDASSIPGMCTVVNLGYTVHQGVEAGFGGTLLKGIWEHGAAPDKVWFNLAYTYSDFFFDNDPVWGDNQLPGIPPHYIRAELLYKHPSGFYAGPNVEWVPTPYYVDDANTLNTAAYALLNFRIGYDKGGPFTAYIDARNLFNTAYIATVSVTGRATQTSALFEPGNGRSVYAGIRYTW